MIVICDVSLVECRFSFSFSFSLATYRREVTPPCQCQLGVRQNELTNRAKRRGMVELTIVHRVWACQSVDQIGRETLCNRIQANNYTQSLTMHWHLTNNFLPARAVLGVVILSVRPSVCHTRAF